MQGVVVLCVLVVLGECCGILSRDKICVLDPSKVFIRVIAREQEDWVTEHMSGYVISGTSSVDVSYLPLYSSSINGIRWAYIGDLMPVSNCV
ncbi:hypothetical protein ES702_02743 [subsurface metagenome]